MPLSSYCADIYYFAHPLMNNYNYSLLITYRIYTSQGRQFFGSIYADNILHLVATDHSPSPSLGIPTRYVMAPWGPMFMNATAHY